MRAVGKQAQECLEADSGHLNKVILKGLFHVSDTKGGNDYTMERVVELGLDIGNYSEKYDLGQEAFQFSLCK